MTCRGRVHNGTIVLEEPTGLPEGAEVEVEVKPAPAPAPAPARKVGRETIEKLSEGIRYDFDALRKLREASKL
jgi:hypothetical protein